MVGVVFHQRVEAGTRTACCTLSSREPETRRERECRWEHSFCLGSSRVVSVLVSRLVRSRFFSSPWCTSPRVSCLAWLLPCVLPGCCLVSRAKIESSRQECRESYSLSLVSGNSRPRLLQNALGESVQPALSSIVIAQHTEWLETSSSHSTRRVECWCFDEGLCNLVYCVLCTNRAWSTSSFRIVHWAGGFEALHHAINCLTLCCGRGESGKRSWKLLKICA